MAYTALPGHYGVEEEESEMTLGFWYLFQEALWGGDLEYDSDSSIPPANKREAEQMNVAKAVYSELMKVLQRKVTWPPKSELQTWPKGEIYVESCGTLLIPVKIRRTNFKRKPLYSCLSVHGIDQSYMQISTRCWRHASKRVSGSTIASG